MRWKEHAVEGVFWLFILLLIAIVALQATPVEPKQQPDKAAEPSKGNPVIKWHYYRKFGG
jgi:hypothetical protein